MEIEGSKDKTNYSGVRIQNSGFRMKKPSNTKRNSSLSHKVHLQDCATTYYLLTTTY